MIYINILLLISLNILILSISPSKSNDVLGCGGFIKSHVPIDFSKIIIELITKQGIVKDRTSCAPNGYYFIPLYDHGEYVLQLVPPPGWSFTHTKVNLAIDGITDLCSEGKDINFVFKGFGITGKIENFRDSKSGPAGVDVELISSNEIRRTITSLNGNFFFTPVYPGSYTVSVSHKKWKFFKNVVNVEVAEGNTELPTGSLVISGYDVSGFVRSEGQPVSKAKLVLIRHVSNTGPVNIAGCSFTQFDLEVAKYKANQLCNVESNEQGLFVFSTVSPGRYFIIPYYKSPNSHFHPDLIEVIVENDSVKLSKAFEIIGFTLSGRVLHYKNGRPLKGARVELNSKEVGITKDDGSFVLQEIKVDFYNLKIYADKVLFEEVTLKVDPNLSKIPDLYPSHYQVCGKVVSDKPQTVKITSVESGESIATVTDANNEFCNYLTIGKYKLHVVVDDFEKSQGIQFFPTSRYLEVTTSPISEIIFSQLKAVVTGKVECLRKSDCASLQVVLRAVSDIPNENKEVIVNIVDNSYTIQDVRPGAYQVLLISNTLCWKKDKHNLSVNSATETVPPFVHNGYIVTFISSHATKGFYKLHGSESNGEPIEIPKGRTLQCIKNPGLYELSLRGCHTYENDVILFNTDDDVKELIITAHKHLVTVAIEAKENVSNLFVNVTIGDIMERRGPLMYKNGKYLLTLFLDSNEAAVITPQSSTLYFKPASLSIAGYNDCTDVGVVVHGVKGKVFKGKVIPPLAGVLITIESSDNSDILTMETNSIGEYQFPPQDNFKNYKVTAKKDTYILVGPNGAGDFLAQKLAEVIVNVVDDNSALQGTLLSLSGVDGYRSNLQTNEVGKISFHSLSPGEYFLKPMMKEYVFEPNSKIIQLKEGASVVINLRGKRIAYSCFGHATSLNGELEDRIIIIAEGLGNCSHFSGDATSESNGQFRIRGLHPYCNYNIYVKSSLDENRPIERAAPSLFKISVTNNDIFNIKFTVFKRTPNTDIMIYTYSPNPDIYKQLKVKLSRESPPSSLMHTLKLDHPNYKITEDNNIGVLLQFPSVPLDDKIYSVQLESISSNSKIEAQSQLLIANSSFKYISFKYLSQEVQMEQNIKQTSVWSLLLIFGIMIAVYNIQELVRFGKAHFGNLNFINFDAIFNNPKKVTPSDYVIDKNEIDQMVQNINAPKRKVKPRKT